jgi:hypothetical protein
LRHESGELRSSLPEPADIAAGVESLAADLTLGAVGVPGTAICPACRATSDTGQHLIVSVRER